MILIIQNTQLVTFILPSNGNVDEVDRVALRVSRSYVLKLFNSLNIINKQKSKTLR